jgi:hypothetical protein
MPDARLALTYDALRAQVAASGCWAVLHEDKAGSNLANDARHVAPEAGPVTVDAGAGPGHADVLAR